MTEIDRYTGKRVHMIGIGGSSMSGLVDFLLARGIKVTGSDRDNSHHVEALVAKGVPVMIGHKAENVHGAAASSAQPWSIFIIRMSREYHLIQLENPVRISVNLYLTDLPTVNFQQSGRCRVLLRRQNIRCQSTAGKAGLFQTRADKTPDV